jgi:NADH-quinone oxidoreductase subunit L
MYLAIAVLAPLFGSSIALLFGRQIGDRAAQAVTIFCMLLASACGVISWINLLYGWDHGHSSVVDLGTWVQIGSFHVDWALRNDPLSVSMVAMVTCVATLIHIYSVGYMHEDSTIWRFFSYLSLFSFAMLMLVTADNLLQLFFGWEGVGLASYLLIGYWYEKPSACAAAMKAFIVNRIGDLGFAAGIALVYWQFGSINFADIFAALPKYQDATYHLLGADYRAYEVIGVLLFIGAMGKSAQLGLHVWLPDAMEGPTPVSALIHAATMVTAGVFLMARMSPLMDYAPGALQFVTIIGGSTALFAATVGCAQNDIKRVIAYSTCSQLGYMFVAAGVGAYQASIFHLLTHAFFKAMLFMGAGSVIMAMHHEQDMRKMGGIWKLIPVTYVIMWIGNLALAGVPPFAGYFSKDAILEAAWASETLVGHYGFWCGILAAFLTAFYSWRLLIMTFHGKPRADHHTMAHVHESPFVVLLPLCLLALGAIFSGWLLHDQVLGENWKNYWDASIQIAPTNHVLHNMEEVPGWVSLLPTLMGVCGIALSYVCYMFFPGIPAAFTSMFGGLYRFVLNKWYFDELYDAIFVRPTMCIARLFWDVDAKVVDGMPNGVASLTVAGSGRAVKLQTGSIANYAFTMLIGLVVLVGVYLMFR